MIIYKIQNKINGMIYVGQTKSKLDRRISDHLSSGKSYVQRALRKYGIESFSISVIDQADERPLINEKERYWIKFYNCNAPNGYNFTRGGEGNTGPRTEETKEKLRRINTGKHLSDAVRQKMSQARLKWLENPENRQRELEAKCRGDNHPRGMKGKHHSKDTIQKFKEARIGNPGNRKGPWNKGLTRTTDERVLRQALSMHKGRWEKASSL